MTLGDTLIAGSDLLSVKFLDSGSDIYTLSLIASTCSTDTLSESFCVQTQLDFIEQQQLISVEDTACLDVPLNIVNGLSASQSCGMSFLWSVLPVDTLCYQILILIILYQRN